jgi:hypothetical protein
MMFICRYIPNDTIHTILYILYYITYFISFVTYINFGNILDIASTWEFYVQMFTWRQLYVVCDDVFVCRLYFR